MVVTGFEKQQNNKIHKFTISPFLYLLLLEAAWFEKGCDGEEPRAWVCLHPCLWYSSWLLHGPATTVITNIKNFNLNMVIIISKEIMILPYCKNYGNLILTLKDEHQIKKLVYFWIRSFVHLSWVNKTYFILFVISSIGLLIFIPPAT